MEGAAIWAATNSHRATAQSLMRCPSGLSPVSLWAVGQQSKGHPIRHSKGVVGFMWAQPVNPKKLLFFSSILLGDFHNFIN